MYGIYSGGELLALCDKPRYVRLNEQSGAYIEATKDKAQAIAVNGELYNIPGGNAIENAPEAVAVEVEAGEIAFSNRARIVQNEETTGAAVVEIENAMCESDMQTDGRLTEVENALCELDAAING